jgi:hypothetical protein
MLFDMRFGRMIRMLLGMGVMGMSQMRMVRSLLMVAFAMKLRGLGVMLGSQRVMMSSFFMMMCSFL